jgi:hypothetical protein
MLKIFILADREPNADHGDIKISQRKQQMESLQQILVLKTQNRLYLEMTKMQIEQSSSQPTIKTHETTATFQYESKKNGKNYRYKLYSFYRVVTAMKVNL